MMINFLGVLEMIIIFLNQSLMVLFKIGDMGGGNCSMNNYTLSQQYLGYNNDDVSSINCFINIHTISQWYYSRNFRYMNGDVFILRKHRIFMNILKLPLYDKNKLYHYIIYVTFLSVRQSILFVNTHLSEFYILMEPL